MRLLMQSLGDKFNTLNYMGNEQEFGAAGEYRCGMSTTTFILKIIGGRILFKCHSPGGPANKASCHKTIVQYKESVL